MIYFIIPPWGMSCVPVRLILWSVSSGAPGEPQAVDAPSVALLFTRGTFLWSVCPKEGGLGVGEWVGELEGGCVGGCVIVCMCVVGDGGWGVVC